MTSVFVSFCPKVGHPHFLEDLQEVTTNIPATAQNKIR